MKLVSTLTVLSAVVLFSCNQTPKKEEVQIEPELSLQETEVKETKEVDNSPEGKYVSAIENAHAQSNFVDKKNVSFDLVLSFGGQERVNGRVSMNTATSLLRLDSKDGSSVIYDGSNVHIAPAAKDPAGARFGIFTWTYFFALPYKLSDPGVNFSLQENKELNGKSYQTSKMTFEDNVGDAPDDWYILYTDPQTKQLEAAAYIVTFGSGDVEKAEQDPHAITYQGYQEVDGIPIATQWKFYGWTEEAGLTDQLGEATLSNIRFDDLEPNAFEVPEDSKIVE